MSRGGEGTCGGGKATVASDGGSEAAITTPNFILIDLSCTVIGGGVSRRVFTLWGFTPSIC